MQHGGPPAALLLGALEGENGVAGRITAARVDFPGPIPLVPNPIDWLIATKMKNTDAMATAIAIARPMFRRESEVSSPSVAAPSKPA